VTTTTDVPAPFVPPPGSWEKPRFVSNTFEYLGPGGNGLAQTLRLELDLETLAVRAWLSGREVVPSEDMKLSALLLGGGAVAQRITRNLMAPNGVMS
jgi:hypothetical protein